MKSRRTKSFQKLFTKLPLNVQDLAIKSYKLWIRDQSHPSLHFKKIQDNPEMYSVRIGIHWRAIGITKEDFIYWHWIGSHEEYNKIV